MSYQCVQFVGYFLLSSEDMTFSKASLFTTSYLKKTKRRNDEGSNGKEIRTS